MSWKMRRASNSFKLKALGFILVLFGAVNTVMNLLTNINVDFFDLFLIVAGVALFALGSLLKIKNQRAAKP